MTTHYILDQEALKWGMSVEHLDGVPWHDAPIPRRWHRCWPQTKGMVSGGMVRRCACGALQRPLWSGRPYWIDRNTRRKETKS
jgi:hypothetical protein